MGNDIRDKYPRKLNMWLTKNYTNVMYVEVIAIISCLIFEI